MGRNGKRVTQLLLKSHRYGPASVIDPDSPKLSHTDFFSTVKHFWDSLCQAISLNSALALLTGRHSELPSRRCASQTLSTQPKKPAETHLIHGS